MCLGIPLYHQCSHTSVWWYYCPSAKTGEHSGDIMFCNRPTWGHGQATDQLCPLTHCDWHNKPGPWQCCACHQGPNYLGWCSMLVQLPSRDKGSGKPVKSATTTCLHGCCENCNVTDSGWWDPQSLARRTLITAAAVTDDFTSLSTSSLASKGAAFPAYGRLGCDMVDSGTTDQDASHREASSADGRSHNGADTSHLIGHVTPGHKESRDTPRSSCSQATKGESSHKTKGSSSGSRGKTASCSEHLSKKTKGRTPKRGTKGNSC